MKADNMENLDVEQGERGGGKPIDCALAVEGKVTTPSASDLHPAGSFLDELSSEEELEAARHGER